MKKTTFFLLYHLLLCNANRRVVRKKRRHNIPSFNRNFPICVLLADPPSILMRTRRRDGIQVVRKGCWLSTMTVTLLSKRRNRFDSRAHLYEKRRVYADSAHIGGGGGTGGRGGCRAVLRRYIHLYPISATTKVERGEEVKTGVRAMYEITLEYAMVPRGCYPSVDISHSLFLSSFSLLFHSSRPGLRHSPALGHSSWSGAPNYTSRVTDENRDRRSSGDVPYPLKRRLGGHGPPRRPLARSSSSSRPRR